MAGIGVDPSSINLFEYDTFNVSVRITNVTDLCGWQFQLFWNSTVLNCTSVATQTPPEWGSSIYNFSPTPALNNNYNATNGCFSNIIVCLRPAPSFNGSTTLATLTFKAMQPGTTSLTLVAKIGDSNANSIPHTVTNGSVIVYNATCAMKTCANGYFYVPNLVVTAMKIEFTFNDTLVGDQTGGVSPYPNITKWPDGTVDMYDALLISACYGATEGGANWNYMADIVPDGVIDIYDSMQVSNHYGDSGTYSMNLTGVNVTFNVGNPIVPDSNGLVQIPQGASSFAVYKNGSPTGAMIVFGKSSM